MGTPGWITSPAPPAPAGRRWPIHTRPPRRTQSPGPGGGAASPPGRAYLCLLAVQLLADVPGGDRLRPLLVAMTGHGHPTRSTKTPAAGASVIQAPPLWSR